MSMLPDGIIPIGEGGQGRVFDFICDNGSALITDYRHLDKDVWASNSIEVSLGNEKERISITSIEALKGMLNKILSAALEILSNHTPFDPGNPYTHPDFNGLKMDLLVDQLVFDVLFDKYIKESTLMTRNGYATHISKIVYCNDNQRLNRIPAIERNLARGMKDHYNTMKYSEFREQLKMLGVDPDKYDEYYNPKIRDNPNKKKPKFIWDQFYYNYGRKPIVPISDDECDPQTQYGHSTITSRQYRRQLTRDNRNYSYEEIVNDLKSYNSFATMLLPAEYESYEKYFRMSMDYYALEAYKRVDFIFKLIDALDPDEIATIDKNHFLVRRFVPCVLVPFIQDGELHFNWKHKYYRPMFIIEDMLLKELQIKKVQLKEAFPQEEQAVNNDCEKYYDSQLKKYQYVRAKAYELFKYHCIFHSNNYVEIKRFLRECYDMRSYHQSNTFWNLLQGSEWNKLGSVARRNIMEQVEHFLAISDALFWKSSARDNTKPKADN